MLDMLTEGVLDIMMAYRGTHGAFAFSSVVAYEDQDGSFLECVLANAASVWLGHGLQSQGAPKAEHLSLDDEVLFPFPRFFLGGFVPAVNGINSRTAIRTKPSRCVREGDVVLV